ncbi:conserved hypothetical protein [Burkholderia pseudomallei MSHR346]|nr:conserved hypothetical protein [Burkholderia pseudomallei MSHR346]
MSTSVERARRLRRRDRRRRRADCDVRSLADFCRASHARPARAA